MRHEEVIRLVTDGRATVPPFVRLPSGVEVWADALQIDGVRVGVSARTAQAVADLLGLRLTTPEVEDEVSRAAVVRIPAFTFDVRKHDIASAEVEAEHSRKIDRAIADAGGKPGQLVSTVGKAWVLVEALTNLHGGRAANYGWHTKGAPYKARAAGALPVWQPVSTAHNLDHRDYSQTLRLCRFEGVLPGGGPTRIPGLEVLPELTPAPYDLSEVDDPEPDLVLPDVPAATLGELAVAVAREEMARELRSSPATIARYHAVAVRGGKPLGIRTGNHCASAASWCALEAARRHTGQVRIPHEPRAAAKELMVDAQRLGAWRPRGEVLAGHYRPEVGDLAVYDRSVKGRADTAWWGHVDRVTGMVDGQHYEAIGANEVGGAWRADVNRLDHSRLLGFVSYSAEVPLGLAVPAAIISLALPPDAAG